MNGQRVKKLNSLGKFNQYNQLESNMEIFTHPSKHLVWGGIVLFIVCYGEPDLIDSAINYMMYVSGGR